ncbi:MAG: hypothetical protein QOH15_1121, partial [Gaiellales bacterium]|nr:hypothetical protein [Gaiellales bacterium]
AAGSRLGRRGARIRSREMLVIGLGPVGVCRLADQEIDVVRVPCERRREARVAGEAQGLPARLDADRMADPRMAECSEGEPCIPDLERRPGPVLIGGERSREMVARRTPCLRQRREALEAGWRGDETRRRPPAQRAVSAAVGEGDQVGAVIEVQVAQDNRVERPRVDRQQRREGSAPAVEQDARPSGLDEIGRARLTGIRPGRPAADDGQRRRARPTSPSRESPRRRRAPCR